MTNTTKEGFLSSSMFLILELRAKDTAVPRRIYSTLLAGDEASDFRSSSSPRITQTILNLGRRLRCLLRRKRKKTSVCKPGNNTYMAPRSIAALLQSVVRTAAVVQSESEKDEDGHESCSGSLVALCSRAQLHLQD